MRARRGLAVLAAAVVVLAGGPARAGGIPSVPDRIGSPGLRTPDLEDKPAGAASVALSGVKWGLVGHMDQVAVVGATADAYRTLGSGTNRVAGMSSQLSPDGQYLAFGQGIADLTTGKITGYPAPVTGDAAAQAWSPDGRLVAVTAYGQNQAALHLYDRATARLVKIADLDPARRMDGWTVAFAPDGKRLAYQSGSTITVAALDGKQITHFTVAAGDSLAGKGAWAPDSSTLLIARAAACTCGKTYHLRWTLTPVDAGTGAIAGQEMGFPGLYAVRALGWNDEGRLVVAAYYPDPKLTIILPMADQADRDDLRRLPFIDTVKVVRVESDAGATTLLSAEPKAAQSIDVPDALLASGATRTGHPPAWHADQLLGLGVTAGVALLVAAALATGFYFFLLRRRREQSAA